MKEEDIKRLEKMGYRFAGKNNHASVKICNWTRESIRGKNVCYKEKFYGIKSHRCMQVAVGNEFCTHNCTFCWRDTNITSPEWTAQMDDPKELLNDMIEAQRDLLQGFKGSETADKEKFYEAMLPNQVAISLAGEPTLYPRLPEFIDLLKERNMTSFLVTNGTQPEMIKKLLDHKPYQMYVTLAAPNEEIYLKTCRPVVKGTWNKLLETLSLLKNFERSVIRLTLVKNMNMVEPENYAKLIEESSPRWVEAKGYMAIGFSRERLGPEYMPTHEEIKNFAKEIEKHSSYKIVDEKEESRVVLLSKK